MRLHFGERKKKYHKRVCSQAYGIDFTCTPNSEIYSISLKNFHESVWNENTVEDDNFK